MTSDQILEQLKRILIEDLDLNLSYEDLDGQVPLFEGGLSLDSVVVVELISFVEQRFKIELPEEALKLDAFKDLESVARAVQEQLPLPRSA